MDRPSVNISFERFLDLILPDLAFLAEFSEEPELFSMLGDRLIGLARRVSAAELREKESFFNEFREIECDQHFRAIADSVLENMYRLMKQTGEEDLVRRSTECLMQILRCASLSTGNINQRWAAVNILSTFKEAEEAWQLKLNPSHRDLKAH